MAMKLIAGRSGQGKTTHVLREVIRLSRNYPRKKYYIIVPEQFSLEMQRKLVELHPDHGYVNIDVLSFNRLAYRVFEECRFQPKDILEDLGVSLLLKQILTEHEEEFSFFKKSIRKQGFVDELKSMLMEFICYDVSWEKVKELPAVLTEHPGLRDKCRELGILYEYFVRAMSDRFMVAEQITDVLCEKVPFSKLLEEGIFYFDGFTGFTPIQLKVLRELGKVSDEVNITVCTDREPAGEASFFAAENGEEELFYFSDKTVRSLARICKEAGIHMEVACLPKTDPLPRFDNEEMAFLEKNLFRLAPAAYEKPPEHLHLVSCLNPDTEAEYVLHKVEQLVREENYRYRDIAVLTGNVDEYAAAFLRKAQALSIPLFVDTKKRISYISGVETLRSLVHLAVTDYSYEGVFRYLKSGMSDFSPEDTDYLENYVLWAGIRGYGMWKKPFVRRMGGMEEEKQERLNTLRCRLLAETESCYAVLRGKKQTVGEKIKALCDAMSSLRYEEKLEKLADRAEEAGEYVREKEYRNLCSLLLELFEKITGIFGDRCMPLSELSEVLDAGLDALKLGTPPLSADALCLGDLKRTRLTDAKVLFLVGVNEGKIPPAPEDRGILLDEEKRILKDQGVTLSLSLSEQSMEDDFYLYLALAHPSHALYFSYCMQESDGKATAPSSFLKDLRQLFPQLALRAYPEEEPRLIFTVEDGKEMLLRGLSRFQDGEETSEAFRRMLRCWYEEEPLKNQLLRMWDREEGENASLYLPGTVTRELFGTRIRGSVTRLERFAACPYSYFCQYGLELYPRKIYEIGAPDLGTLFHAALQDFSQRVKDSEYLWRTLPETVADHWAVEAADKAAAETIGDVLAGSARNQYKIHMVHRILRRTIRVIQSHLQNSFLEPDRFEFHFGRENPMNAVLLPLKNGNQMQMEGLIDRVDVCEEADRVLIRIVDYKSGKKPFSLNELYHGIQMQLIIYMNVALEYYEKETGKETVPAGVFYCHLQDPVLNLDKEGPENGWKEFRMNGYANSDPAILSCLENGDGEFVSASVRLTKKGVPYKSSKVMDTGDFYRVGSYVREKITALGEEIFDGNVSASPYVEGNLTACTYCPYGAVCGFDRRLGTYAFRDIGKLDAEEVLEAIRRETESSQETGPSKETASSRENESESR